MSKGDYSGGIGVCGVLFCIFLVLKLAGLIDWSWFWVTSPLWISFAFVAIVIAVTAIIVGIYTAIDYINRR